MPRSTGSLRRGISCFVQKPSGQLATRVQAVGPEHFGIVSIDCGKTSSCYTPRGDQ